MPRVKVAYMIEGLGVGGSERQILELLRRLDRRAFEPKLYSGTSGLLIGEVRELSIPVTFLYGQWGGGKLATLSALREILRFRPHVIHSYGFVANTWACVSGALARTPVVITGVRGILSDLTRVQSAVEKATRNMPDHVISNSEADRQRLCSLGVPESRVSVVHNGIDPLRFPFPRDRMAARAALHLDRGRPTIGMVASFRAIKRWDVFLRAAAILAKSQALHILCVGDGELRRGMEHLSSTLGISDITRFLGVRSDVQTVMAAMDVLVSSSDSEGLSNVIMEAMASGVPVVATAVGGSPELVSDRRTGYLVPRRDPGALAQAVKRVLERTDGGSELGLAARERIKNEFSIDACVRETLKVYRTQLADKDVRTPQFPA